MTENMTSKWQKPWHQHDRKRDRKCDKKTWHQNDRKHDIKMTETVTSTWQKTWHQHDRKRDTNMTENMTSTWQKTWHQHDRKHGEKCANLTWSLASALIYRFCGIFLAVLACSRNDSAVPVYIDDNLCTCKLHHFQLANTNILTCTCHQLRMLKLQRF